MCLKEYQPLGFTSKNLDKLRAFGYVYDEKEQNYIYKSKSTKKRKNKYIHNDVVLKAVKLKNKTTGEDIYYVCHPKVNKNKGVFVLCLTSNRGAKDFQSLKAGQNSVSDIVASVFIQNNKFNNLGFVIGATQSDRMNQLREITPNTPWLIPGVGTQGGNLEESIIIGFKNGGIPIINISRSIIYAGEGSIKDIRNSAMEYTRLIRNTIEKI